MRLQKAAALALTVLFLLAGCRGKPTDSSVIDLPIAPPASSAPAWEEPSSAPAGGESAGSASSAVQEDVPDEHGAYTTKDDVALYLKTYGRLPENFITKREARALGWQGGSLEPYAPGRCIGGDLFGNLEGRLPKQKGRVYRECDIDTLGARSRGAKRIIFSDDGLIYYTEDHYETFTLLYGEE